MKDAYAVIHTRNGESYETGIDRIDRPDKETVRQIKEGAAGKEAFTVWADFPDLPTCHIARCQLMKEGVCLSDQYVNPHVYVDGRTFRLEISFSITRPLMEGRQ